ncbi:hypothetical protein BKA82DRAFT_24315 [Pisolithus tinctorius]|uniref:Uncharacterized protein n=1 Tax=Pisolithus tinctorius Marx 270 TaxID=870435 RepID=A0A0C3KAB6_PISTI|nr:hypothetical protein BKA82DRAFT_24315 [Pisolithus tinctorius]KIO06582.1 hypothetical protein M404DRAFT_24315 [Pisolithus tinctorius Marx 270]
MVNELPPGQYIITSVADQENLGVSNIVPLIFPPPPIPVIVLPDGVLPPRFTIELVNGGDNTYVILVEKRNTRGQDERVFAFENEPAEEWVIIYREPQNAYTIERRGGPLAWTAPPREQPLPERQILLNPLVVQLSEPPQFLPTQLFRFTRVIGE